MKKLLLIYLFTFGAGISAQAQSDTANDAQKIKAEKIKGLYEKYKDNKIYLKKGNKEYTAYYDKLKALELQKNNTPSELESDWLYKSFYKNINQKFDVSLITQQDTFFKWIEENINSTNFRNVEAAKEDWLRLEASRKKSIESNSDYYDYLMELALSIENFSELVTDVTTAVLYEEIEKNKKK